MAMVVGAVVRLLLAAAVVSYIFLVHAKGVAGLQAPHPESTNGIQPYDLFLRRERCFRYAFRPRPSVFCDFW